MVIGPSGEMELRYQIVFRPFGRAKDECSRRPLVCVLHSRHSYVPVHRAAAGTGDRQGCRKVEQRRSSCRDVPSADPLRQAKSEVPRPSFRGGAKAAPAHPCARGISASLHVNRGANGFGYFRRNESTSPCGGETPRHTLSLKATHHKSTYVLSVPSRSCRSSAS